MKVSTNPPPELAHLMVWYSEIRGQALRGQYFEPIQFTEIIAYSTGFGLDIDPVDFDLIVRLDRIWRRMQPKPGDKPGNSK